MEAAEIGQSVLRHLSQGVIHVYEVAEAHTGAECAEYAEQDKLREYQPQQRGNKAEYDAWKKT